MARNQSDGSITTGSLKWKTSVDIGGYRSSGGQYVTLRISMPENGLAENYMWERFPYTPYIAALHERLESLEKKISELEND